MGEYLTYSTFMKWSETQLLINANYGHKAKNGEGGNTIPPIMGKTYPPIYHCKHKFIFFNLTWLYCDRTGKDGQEMGGRERAMGYTIYQVGNQGAP